jgi:hypothetical protein
MDKHERCDANDKSPNQADLGLKRAELIAM